MRAYRTDTDPALWWAFLIGLLFYVFLVKPYWFHFFRFPSSSCRTEKNRASSTADDKRCTYYNHKIRKVLKHVDALSRFRNVIVASGLLAFAAGGLAFPFFFVKSKNKPIIDSSKPLPPQATFRGPYVNTGSHDIGPDTKTYPKT